MSGHRRAMRRNIVLLNLHAGLLSMLFILPVIVPYYRRVIGLDFGQFMIGEAAFSAIVLLMEVPSGWLSDIWTRKAAMFAGTLFNVLGWLWLWLAHSFLGATLAQMTIGVGASLLSGTNSAMLYESLLDLDAGEQFRRREGLRGGIVFYLCGLSSLCGGALYAWRLEAPVILTWATSALALAMVPLLREPLRRGREGPRRHPLADMAATMRYALRGHANIAALIVFSGVLFSVTKVMFWTQQPYFAAIGMPVAVFGGMLAGSQLLAGAGGHYGHKLDGRLTVQRVLAGGFVFALLSCLVASITPGLIGAMLLVGASPLYAIIAPRVQSDLARQAPPERRATILSSASFIVHLFSLPLLLAGGWLATSHGVRANLAGLALLLLIGLAALVLKGYGRNETK